MKANIHPKWYPEATVTCGCGNTFKTGSIHPEIKVDICYACHPFFTGEMKFVDVQGRVEKFQAKMKMAKEYKKTSKSKVERTKETPKSLKEMLTTLKPENQPSANK